MLPDSQKRSIVPKKSYQAGGKFLIPNPALSYSINLPTLSAQYGIDFPIPCPVSPEFLFPKFLMALGFCIPAIVAVPKTTIRKHDDPFIGKHEIGFSEQCVVPSPTPQAIPFPEGHKGQFRRSIT
jgi:hypothetical protein